MPRCRILVVDDQADANAERFRRLFEGDESMVYDIAESWDDFRGRVEKDTDVVILDINLDDWGKTLHEALDVIGPECPVFLASQYWDERRTHQRISDALARANRASFVGTLVLNDLGLPDWKQHAFSMRSQIRLAVAKSRHRARLELSDEKPIHILHLSDPQYGDPGNDRLSYLVEKEIPRFVLDDLELDVHFIALTGDVTFSGQPSEFDQAGQRLQTLVEAFLVNRDDWRERVLLVPGNHDVNLRLAAADQVTYEFKSGSVQLSLQPTDGVHRGFALQSFRDFAWQLTGNPQWRDAQDLCWINDSFRHLGLRFYLLNSAAEIDCRHPSKAEIPLGVLRRLVNSRTANDTPFGIALSHHGPASRNDGATKIETLGNWPEIAKHIQNSAIRLLIHGHGHKRFADLVSLAENQSRDVRGRMQETEVLRVMAPTTHLDSQLRPPHESRGFNIITLSRHYGRVEQITVDSYELGRDRPHRANNVAWKCHI